MLINPYNFSLHDKIRVYSLLKNGKKTTLFFTVLFLRPGVWGRGS
ncbi:Uncharacterized protein dnl_61980 [Desulfonema limicola]|uniref:Uncharacterized protein n=1 Tax=Desulfonema limicola TaxID=45656 RepID=A0A975BED9_9BACT|nr:Uncharacterized protein dnl_61980 [Desulfonema limicola]